MKKLSVIIVTYHSQKDILNCLDSLFATADIPRAEIEIIIVDNGSQISFEETRELVTRKYGDEIILIHNPKNGGYGQGNNIGIERSTAEINCIVNPDVLFTVPVMGKAIEVFKNDSSVAMVGGKQHGGPHISFWIRPEYDFFLLTAPLTKVLNLLDIYLQKFFFLSGTFLFIDKNKFDEIGRFDEDIFMYGEEADITRRFVTKNYQTVYRSDFAYRHLIDDRTASNETDLKRMLVSYKIYFAKHHLSYGAYLKRRIISLYVLMIIGKVFGMQNLYAKNKSYLDIFKKSAEPRGM
ncbi:MAG: glycosyltransferase family 2 protein [Kaistella sp.]|nr:glycosyltransferase family 2 protein [Kaistella sp.]